MKTNHFLILALLTGSLLPVYTCAQDGKEPIGGQPPVGTQASITDFDYEVKRQRAFEATLWALPMTSINGFRRAAFEYIGIEENDIIYTSGPATPNLELITPNSTTTYICGFTDLRKDALVLEVPAASDEGSLYGQVVDAWQYTIADIGPSGIDKGKGGKILFTAPDYNKPIPSGYIHVKSPNYRLTFAFRSIPTPGKTTADGVAYSKKVKMYYLSDASNPPQQKFIDVLHKRFPSLPFYDERNFKEIYDIINIEPIKPHDKVMMGMLKSLGIEKGKPYSPNEKTLKAMRQGAIDAWHYLQYWFDNMPKEKYYWTDRHYVSLLMTDKNRMFTWEYEDQIDFTERAAEYFWCANMPKVLSHSPATQYLMAIADRNGNHLEAGKLYKVTVPANMPARQFWALSVFDYSTMAFIYTDSERTTLSSYDLDKMKKNKDGSVTIYIGPKVPKELESNWIPTAGKRPLPGMRIYGPTEELNNKSFKLPDFELVEFDSK